MTLIPDTDISFVVQGPIDPRLTATALASIRKNFPASPVILSTWEGATTTGLSFDEVVFSEDPGAVHQSDAPKVFDNVNRQLVSTRAGLTKVHTRYAVKTRTDFWFRGRGFVYWIDRSLPRDLRYSLFSSRLVIPNYNVKNPDRIPLLFHPSDLVAAGRTEDVSKMFAAPLRDVAESRFFSDISRPIPDIYPDLLSRFTAEQYIWLSALGERKPVDFHNLSTFNTYLRDYSDSVLVNNFVVLSPRQYGLVFSKYPRREWGSWTSYTHLEWRLACDRHLGTRFRGRRPDFELWGYWLYHIARKVRRMFL